MTATLAAQAHPRPQPPTPPSAGPPSRLLGPPMPTDRVLGWVAPLVLTLLAGVLRFVGLTSPPAVVDGKVSYTFDEVYYTKEAYDLLSVGVERGANCEGVGFVVHPPLGKWMIALGEWLFGYIDCAGQPHGDPALGWRFSAALAGTVTVLMIARIARRMFRSTLLGCFAGLLFALDGLAFVQSRIGILDVFLAFWIVAALGCLVVDRDWSRGRLAATGATGFWRPWLLGCGACLGAATAVKWSGAYAAPAFAALALAWDVGARRSAGVRQPFVAWVLGRPVLAWAACFLVLPVAIYTLSWAGWFATDRGFNRADPQFDGGGPVEALRGWLDYHEQARRFHEQLASSHPYEANSPFQWLVLARPALYSYQGLKAGEGGCTVDGGCSRTVLALGSPAIWWPALVALLVVLWLWVARRDWRCALVLVGFLSGFLPWLAFPDRTKFAFYALPLLPFVVLGVTAVAGLVLGSRAAGESRRLVGALAVGGYAMLVVVAFVYFHPIWSNALIPTAEWRARMWFPSWV